jgi:hypothetical protein
MKLTNETIFSSSIVIGLSSLLYSYMVLHRKIKSINKDINLIMSTHLLYMETRDEHCKEIKSINNTLEEIALKTPYRGEGWQSRFIRHKIKRDLEHHFPDENKDTKFYDDEPLEEGF